mmetsp:Transcript_68643/g.201478  ORF Transcript_68643/g.201478 Transcript_68643/m.201478 type:complete len:256 (+) Transcript_68643:495-1262(+)
MEASSLSMSTKEPPFSCDCCVSLAGAVSVATSVGGSAGGSAEPAAGPRAAPSSSSSIASSASSRSSSEPGEASPSSPVPARRPTAPSSSLRARAPAQASASASMAASSSLSRSASSMFSSGSTSPPRFPTSGEAGTPSRRMPFSSSRGFFFAGSRPSRSTPSRSPSGAAFRLPPAMRPSSCRRFLTRRAVRWLSSGSSAASSSAQRGWSAYMWNLCRSTSSSSSVHGRLPSMAARCLTRMASRDSPASMRSKSRL